MADLTSVKAKGGSALSAVAYAGAALAGVIAANYSPASIGNYGNLVLGLVAFVVPIWVITENSGYWGPVRMFFAVGGLTLVLRSILGNGTATSGLISIALPAQVGAVI
jgi:hypothetical protein